MDEYQQKVLKSRTNKKVINLQISDNFEYRDKGLIEIMRVHYENIRTGLVNMEDNNENEAI